MKKKAKSASAKVTAPKKEETSKIKFRPAGDRVLVRPMDAADEKTPSGIFIPDTAHKEKPEKGTIVAVGPGKRGDDNEVIPVPFEIGDVVMFSKYGFDEVTIDEQEYFIVPESGILGIF